MNSSCMLVIAQDVADVLAEEALDALPELLHPIDVLLLHRARCHRPRPQAAALNGAIVFLTRKFHDTSVTRSLISGNARIGSTVTGSSIGRRAEPGHAHQLRAAVDLRGA